MVSTRFYRYTVKYIKELVKDTYSLFLVPVNGEHITEYKPGQFCNLKNPSVSQPYRRSHFFSITSPSGLNDGLEFCFKVYGEWTRRLSQLKTGDVLGVAGPYGKFVWDGTVNNAVFLAGGMGITPFISMIRSIRQKDGNPELTLIYGNRTAGQIAYREELESLFSQGKNIRIIHVLSDEIENTGWCRYKGFITKDILINEISNLRKNTFFLSGPPIFTSLMNRLLTGLSIPPQQIRLELFT